jgi:ribonuclease E
MTVIDVNTGKFTGSGGNLEETVTRNNLEAAEEIVRQLRLRDIGGIIVVDFIDMVLESNRDLVLRRLTECLGRDRTRHQVAEVTSLGLVQMTRKRVGTGLLEAFSITCEHCRGRGVLVSTTPVHMHSTVVPSAAPVTIAPAPEKQSQNGTPSSAGASNGSGQSGGGSRRNRHRNNQSDHEKAGTDKPEEKPADAPQEVVVESAPVEQVTVVEVSPKVETSPNGHQPTPTPAVAVANPPRPTRRRAASRPAGPPAADAEQRGE